MDVSAIAVPIKKRVSIVHSPKILGYFITHFVCVFFLYPYRQVFSDQKIEICFFKKNRVMLANFTCTGFYILDTKDEFYLGFLCKYILKYDSCVQNMEQR